MTRYGLSTNKFDCVSLPIKKITTHIPNNKQTKLHSHQSLINPLFLENIKVHLTKMTTVQTTAQEFMTTLIVRARELGFQPCDLMAEMSKITPKRRGRPPTAKPVVVETRKRSYTKVRPDKSPDDATIGETAIDANGRTA